MTNANAGQRQDAMNKSIHTLILALLATSGLNAQIVLDQTLTPVQLVEEVLLGAGVQVSNITFNGLPGTTLTQQASSFNGLNCNVGIEQGVMLATGSVLNAEGPNDSGSSSLTAGETSISDPDLLLLSGNASINDAAVLEFDFIPIGDSILFDFVFASDEYLEFVNSINDAFGFFLSGPNITGPYSNNSMNIALIPGTTDPVTINTVNDVVNSAFYVNNGDGFTAPFNTDPTYVQYDGLTVRLTARAAVACGQVHHIKICVGDASDTVWDSAVFLEGGSFTSPPFIPDLQPGPGIVGQNTILESCFNVDFLFSRIGDSTLAATVEIFVGGTATPGVDYVPDFPVSLSFAPFQSAIPFSLNAPIDADGPETIELTLVSESPCSADSLAITFDFIIDQPDPLIAIGTAHLIECGESVQLTPTISGGYGAYNLLWNPTNQTDSAILYTPTTVSDVYVQVVDTCGGQTTGFFAVELTLPPPISATLSGPDPLIEGCDNANLVVTRPAGTSGDLLITIGHIGQAGSPGDYTHPPVIIPGGSTTVSTTVSPVEDDTEEGTESAIITVNYSNACQQTVSDTVSTSILDAAPIEITTEQLLIIPCGADSVPLETIVTGGVGSLDLVWNNGFTGSTGYASNSVDGTYMLTVTDDCGRMDSVSITVDPQCAIIVPNVISPNGDGQNDVFFIEGILASKSTVRIFNRWGQMVFEKQNYQNNWAANDLPDGTYFYEVLVDRDPEPYTGHVTVLSNGRRP